MYISSRLPIHELCGVYVVFYVYYMFAELTKIFDEMNYVNLVFQSISVYICVWGKSGWKWVKVSKIG